MAGEVVLGLRNVRIGLGSRVMLQQVNLSAPIDSVTGLVGQNRAGGSTLLRPLAGRETRYTGEASVSGRKLSEAASGTVYLTVKHWPFGGDQCLRDLVRHVIWIHPNFDMERVIELLAWLDVPESRHLVALSRGQHTTAFLSLALVTRAPLTLLDEPYNDLDVPAQQHFIRVLLEELHMFPRIPLTSTHLVDETEPLFQYVAPMEGGRITTAGTVRGLATSFTKVNGPMAGVDALPRLGQLDREGAWASTAVREGVGGDPPARPVSSRELADLLIGPRRDAQVDVRRRRWRRAEASTRCCLPLVGDPRGAIGGP